MWSKLIKNFEEVEQADFFMDVVSDGIPVKEGRILKSILSEPL